MSHEQSLIRVFISSTFEDLQDYREKVIAVIGKHEHLPVAMEFFSAGPDTPVERCVEFARTCDVLVVLVGHRYGWVPPRGAFADGEKSITWIEVDAAAAADKPVLAFLVHEKHLWDHRLTEQYRLNDDSQDPASVVKAIRQLRLFKEFLNTRYTRATFTTPDDLATAVSVSLAKLPFITPKWRPVGYALDEPANPESLALQPYLSWLVESHSRLDLRGLRHANGGSVQVPLDKVYVAMKVDRTNPLERAESRRALEAELLSAVDEGKFSSEDLQHARWYLVAGSPIMPSLESRDRRDTVESTEILTLGDVYRRECRLVILGDPGSGKTTIARWLTLVMARGLADSKDRVEVPTSKVDPEAFNDNLPFILGPPRLPVMLRVAEFAADRHERRERGERPRSLTEFLGHHTWMNSVATWQDNGPGRPAEAIPSTVLNSLIRTHLEKGRALIILDGLDEIPASSLRDEIVEEVDGFTRRWMRSTFQFQFGKSGQETVAVVQPEMAVTGKGNQLIVTSRIAGYHAAPLRGDLTHVTVEPMSMSAVDHFIETWMQGVHERLREPTDSDQEVEERASSEAALLQKEVKLPHRRGVRELTTNPLLASVLATVFHEGEGQLPGQRVELYRIAVENLTEVWHRRPVSDHKSDLLSTEVFDVLEPIAAHIHQHEPTGLIPENQLQDMATRFLAEIRGENPLRPSARLRQTVATLLQVVREDVGLLAARGEGVYGFLHLTFQEYLAARWLVRNLETASRQIIDRLDDSRWREPILMALGHVNTTCPSQFPDLVELILGHDGSLKNLLPQSALLLTAALPEFDRMPMELITRIGNRLLDAYEGDGSPPRLPQLQKLIESAFRQLLDTAGDEPVEECILRALTDNSPEQSSRPAAAASLILRLDWVTQRLGGALIAALPKDSGTWDWPICAVLRSSVTPHLGEIPKYPLRPARDPRVQRYADELERSTDAVYRQDLALRHAMLLENAKAAEARFQLDLATYNSRSRQLSLSASTPRVDLPITDLPFRDALERNPAFLDQVLSDPSWHRLAIALYGGYVDYKTPATIRQYSQIASYLQLEDSDRDPFTVHFRDVWDGDDAIYSMAVFLDERSRLFKSQWQKRPAFQSSAIYRDSYFTRPIVDALRDGRPATDLIPVFEGIWNAGSDPAHQAEALLALTALGCDVTDKLNGHDRKIQLARSRIAQLRLALADPVVRASQHAVKLLEEVSAKADVDSWLNWFDATLGTALDAGSLPLELVIPSAICPTPQMSRILAEQFAHRFSGWGDDAVLSAVDFITDLRVNSRVVVDAFSQVACTQHIRWSGYAFNWPIEQIPPATIVAGDVPFCTLSAIEQIPSQLSHLRQELLTRVLRPIWNMNRDLRPELLAIALFDVGTRSNRDNTLAELAPKLIGRHNAAKSILTKARRLKSPYYKSRAILRLSQHLTESRTELLREAEAAAESIEDANQKAQVLERLVATSPSDWRAELIAKCRVAITEIASQADKSRAWARLSFLASGSDCENLLQLAIAAADQIVEDREKSDTLRLLRQFVQGFPILFGKWLEVCENIRDPLYFSGTVHRHGRVLLDAHARLANLPGANSLFAPLSLRALLADADRSDDGQLWESLWSQFVAEPTDNSLNAILHASNGRAIGLSGAIARMVDEVLASASPTTAYSLFPLLAHPEPESVVVLEKWIKDPRPEIATFGYLLLAEFGGLFHEALPALIQFMRSDNDLLRHRANRVVYGNKMGDENEPRFRVSILGPECIMDMHEAVLDLEEENPGVAIALSWHGQCLLNDDPRAISRWAALAASKSKKAKAARRCLSHIGATNLPAWKKLLHLFKSGPAAVKKAVVIAVARMRHTNTTKKIRFDDSRWNEFLEAISESNVECLKRFRMLPARHECYADVLRTIVDKPVSTDLQAAVSQARESLWKSYGTSFADILVGDSGTIATRLDNMANTLLYASERSSSQARSAAEAIRENADCTKLLLEWLKLVLSEDVSESENLFSFERSYLLEITAELATYSPATFANLADPLLFELPLCLTITRRSSYPGRVAAVRLLGYLRNLSPRIVDVLYKGLRDVTFVQEAVMDAASLFRKQDRPLVQRLTQELSNSSAMAAYASAQMLAAIARSEQVSQDQRRLILQSLARAITDPRSHRTVHFWYTDCTVPNQPQLDDVYFDAMLRIAGIG